MATTTAANSDCINSDMSNTELLIRKLAIAFISGFFGALITSLEGISHQATYSWSKAAVISLIVGALTAGIRAVLALGPINLVPSDKQHSLVNGT